MDQGSPESCRMSLTQSPSFGTPLLPTINNVLISYRQPGRPSSRAHHCPPNSDAATRSRAATTTTMAERPLSGPQGPEQVLFYGVDIQVAHFQCRPTCSLSTNNISLSFRSPRRHHPLTPLPGLRCSMGGQQSASFRALRQWKETTNGLALLCGARLLWLLLERYGTG